MALGVAADGVTVISYGEERPECAQAAESCWRQNRRGVTVAGQLSGIRYQQSDANIALLIPDP